MDIGAFVALAIGLVYKSNPDKNDYFWRIAFAVPILTCLLRMIIIIVKYNYDTPVGYLMRDETDNAEEIIDTYYLEEHQHEVFDDYKSEAANKKKTG